jgi:hypothetical protein
MTDPNETSSLVHSPSEGWSRYPNLRLRPFAPARNAGRLQRQVKRAFIGHESLTSTEVYDWTYARHRARGQHIKQRHRHSVYRILRQIAEPVRKVPPHNAWLWRLRNSDPA